MSQRTFSSFDDAIAFYRALLAEQAENLDQNDTTLSYLRQLNNADLLVIDSQAANALEGSEVINGRKLNGIRRAVKTVSYRSRAYIYGFTRPFRASMLLTSPLIDRSLYGVEIMPLLAKGEKVVKTGLLFEELTMLDGVLIGERRGDDKIDLGQHMREDVAALFPNPSIDPASMVAVLIYSKEWPELVETIEKETEEAKQRAYALMGAVLKSIE